MKDEINKINLELLENKLKISELKSADITLALQKAKKYEEMNSLLKERNNLIIRKSFYFENKNNCQIAEIKMVLSFSEDLLKKNYPRPCI